MKDVKEEYDGDDAVSSSSHVTRFINASVQTPNKLLKGLILESGSSSKSQSAAVHEAVKAAEKKFKHYIEKVSTG